MENKKVLKTLFIRNACMHSRGTLQTMNALVLTVIVIGIVSFILVKLSSPQPIKDVGNFYDSIMNPQDTKPLSQDLLEYKNKHLILHTEYLPPNTVLRLTLRDLKDRTFLQREYHKTRKPIILPTIAPPITHIILDMTTNQQKTQHQYYLLQEHYTRETIRQASHDILTLLKKDKDLTSLFTSCTITPPQGKTILFSDVIGRALSAEAPLSTSGTGLSWEGVPGESRSEHPLVAFTGCRTSDWTAFLQTGMCPSTGEYKGEEQLALFIGNLHDILLPYGLSLLDMPFIRISPPTADELRRAILRKAGETRLEEKDISCTPLLLKV